MEDETEMESETMERLFREAFDAGRRFEQCVQRDGLRTIREIELHGDGPKNVSQRLASAAWNLAR
jgi:hypothetical protein